jgi:hypothetical protein
MMRAPILAGPAVALVPTLARGRRLHPGPPLMITVRT